MGKATFGGYVRQRGDNKPSSFAAVSSLKMYATFDPTSSSQVLLGYLPAGCMPLSVQPLGGATGGTNPTVDVGTLADDDGLANELDADTLGAPTATGALLGTVLTAQTAVYGKVGGSAATGGTTKIAIEYIMSDNGV